MCFLNHCGEKKECEAFVVKNVQMLMQDAWAPMHKLLAYSVVEEKKQNLSVYKQHYDCNDLDAKDKGSCCKTHAAGMDWQWLLMPRG